MPQAFMEFPYSLVGVFALMIALAHAQLQSDFISIDCGLQQAQVYTQDRTGIVYSPDKDYIDSGESKGASRQFTPEQQYWYLRMFPDGKRNCYKIKVKRGQKYIVRASFGYGNYDGAGKLPTFELHLGTNLWDTVVFTSMLEIITKELIHVPERDYLHICLVDVEKGTPFISNIELRPLRNDAYQTEVGTSLAVMVRLNVADDGLQYRYPYDLQDRIWDNTFSPEWRGIKVYPLLLKEDQSAYQLPHIVTSTAAAPISTGTNIMDIQYKPAGLNGDSLLYIYMHFAELEIVQTGSSSELTVSVNDNAIGKPFQPKYLTATTINATIPADTVTFAISSSDVVYQPFVNAFEIYVGKEFPESETNQDDVEAMEKIKSSYNDIKRNWQGDPCYPKDYKWEGVTCSYSGVDSGRIISLDLSSSTLIGEIAASIAKLKMIQTLDLSKNKLSGAIPEFLSTLPNLNTLNLEDNLLTGSVPTGLLKKKKLSLSVCRNQLQKQPAACLKKKNKFIIPVVSSTAGLLIFLIVAGVLSFKGYNIRDVWRLWKLRKGPCVVFLSFRGPDTGKNFTYTLFRALLKEGIKAYFADESIRKGKEIKEDLTLAITKAKVSVAILSKTYVHSHYCLYELATMLECRKSDGQAVIPYFHEVQPNSVKHQTEPFNLDGLHTDKQDNIPTWKAALTEVGTFAGVTSDNYTREVDAIDYLVKLISKEIAARKGDKSKLKNSQSV